MRDVVRRPAAVAAVLLLAALLAEAGARLDAWAACRRGAPPDDAFALYVVGESTPAGVPFGPELSFPALAAGALGRRLAGRPVAVVSLARSGESIYPQEYAFERASSCRAPGAPGAVVVYSGNNDAQNLRVAAPFERLKEIVLARSVLLRGLYYRAERGGLLPRVRTEETYAYYLRRVVELSLARGLTPILFTVPSNLRSMDPGLFTNEYDETPSLAEIDGVLGLGRSEEARGRFDAAILVYRRAAERWRIFKPYADFLTAGCLVREGRPRSARLFYRLARDLSTHDNFGRANSGQNALIRRLAAQERAPLVDAVSLFERRAPGGVPGDELFMDGQHPSLAGAALLADALARALADRYGAADPGGAAGRLALAADRDARVRGFLSSGRWLFSVSCRHLSPGRRLDLAEARFRSALALAPDEFSAWLGLCLVEAARRRPGLLLEPEDWLARYHLLYGERFLMAARDLAEITGKLREAGVPDVLLRRARRAYARLPPSADEGKRRRDGGE